MALDANKLAQKLHDALSTTTDAEGKPTPISRQTLDKAKGVIAALKTATVAHAPGTITGTTAPGAPLENGAGSGGIITITSAPMKAITGQALPPEAIANVATENDALIAYIATGTVTFAAGKIVGTCTNTPLNPGPLAAGAGTEGKIVGLNGAGAAAAVAAARGISGPDSEKHYTALIDYISENAEVAYPPNGVVGVCPAAGGGLEAGSGVGGVIS